MIISVDEFALSLVGAGRTDFQFCETNEGGAHMGPQRNGRKQTIAGANKIDIEYKSFFAAMRVTWLFQEHWKNLRVCF